MKNETAPKKPVTISQLLDMTSVVMQLLARFIVDFTQAQYYIENKDELKKKLRQAFKDAFAIEDDFSSLRQEWQDFYKEVFGWDVDFSRLIIPAKVPDFDRLIIVAKGLMLNKAFRMCKKHFDCWSYYDDLDEIIKELNEREATEHYAIWVRDRVEADEENQNKSYNDLKKENHHGITLLERIILELKYFKEAKSHLDIKNWTLCSASRLSDGGVPHAFWYPDHREFRVHWCSPDYSYSCLRSRSAVTL